MAEDTSAANAARARLAQALRRQNELAIASVVKPELELAYLNAVANVAIAEAALKEAMQ